MSTVVKEAVSTSVKAAQEAVADQREQRAEQRVEREERAEAKRAAADKTSEAAAHMAHAVTTAANVDADAAQKYFTYDGSEPSAPAGSASAPDSRDNEAQREGA